MSAVLDDLSLEELRERLQPLSCTQANLTGVLSTVIAWTEGFRGVHGIHDVQDHLTDALIAAEATYVGALRDE